MRANKLETALSKDCLYSLSGPARYVFSWVHLKLSMYMYAYVLGAQEDGKVQRRSGGEHEGREVHSDD